MCVGVRVWVCVSGVRVWVCVRACVRARVPCAVCRVPCVRVRRVRVCVCVCVGGGGSGWVAFRFTVSRFL